jgi:tRNA nucleotidyltransferase (CCA-adding enzyme)
VGPQDPNDVTRNIARDLSGLAGELAALKADARHWLTDPEYAVLHLRLERTPTRRSRPRSWRPGAG